FAGAWHVTVGVSEVLFSAPDARHYFLLSCQKKVSKEKSRPQRLSLKARRLNTQALLRTSFSEK
ncbi:MAG: hypothetical protein KA779_01725, partial [Propionivibrio sp.]|nr:hypothetical protein [Propionivibrio sp.]